MLKVKIHSSGEIEVFVETRLCKLCVLLVLRSRVLLVYVLIKGIGRRLLLEPACTTVDRVIFFFFFFHPPANGEK